MIKYYMVALMRLKEKALNMTALVMVLTVFDAFGRLDDLMYAEKELHHNELGKETRHGEL